MKSIMFFLACSFVTPGVGYAQTIEQQCGFILAGNIHDESYYLGYDYHAVRLNNWACESGFVSAESMRDFAAELGITVKAIPIGIKLSDRDSVFRASLKQWCDSADVNILEDGFRTGYSRVVSAELVSAFKYCADKKGDALSGRSGAYAYARPENSSLTTFLVTLIVDSPNREMPLELKSIEGSVECRFGNQAIATPWSLSTRETVFTCVSYSGNGASAAFNTSVGSSIVDFPSRDRGRILALERRLLRMEESYDRLVKGSIVVREHRFDVPDRGRYNLDTGIEVGEYPAAALGGWRLYQAGERGSCRENDVVDVFLSENEGRWRILVDKGPRCDTVLVKVVYIPEQYSAEEGEPQGRLEGEGGTRGG